jgi:transcriptional regulator with XRE-family HTH domain
VEGNHIGNHIRALRLARSMTQEDFANRINVAKSTVSAYENGSRLPSYDVLVKIADLFHVTTDNLLGRSSGCMIDVSGLTAKQRNAIQDVVTTYQAFNRLHRQYAAGDVDATL